MAIYEPSATGKRGGNSLMPLLQAAISWKKQQDTEARILQSQIDQQGRIDFANAQRIIDNLKSSITQFSTIEDIKDIAAKIDIVMKGENEEIKQYGETSKFALWKVYDSYTTNKERTQEVANKTIVNNIVKGLSNVRATMQPKTIKQNMDAISRYKGWFGEGDMMDDYIDETLLVMQPIYNKSLLRQTTFKNMGDLREQLKKVDESLKAGKYVSEDGKLLIDDLNQIIKVQTEQLPEDNRIIQQLKALSTEAEERIQLGSYIDSLDIKKYREDDESSIGINLEKPSRWVEWNKMTFRAETLAQEAQKYINAGAYEEANQILNAISLAEHTKKMKIGEAIRDAQPIMAGVTKNLKVADIDKSFKTLSNSLKTYYATINNDAAMASPSQHKAVFNEISQWLYRIVKKEQIVSEPESVLDLDRWLLDRNNQEMFLKDLLGGSFGDKNLQVAVMGVIKIRNLLSTAYEQAYGAPLINVDNGDIDALISNEISIVPPE